MTSITATAFRQNIYQTIAQVNSNCAPIAITIGEDDWAAIEETLYLAGVPGLVESLQEGRAEALVDCVAEDALEW